MLFIDAVALGLGELHAKFVEFCTLCCERGVGVRCRYTAQAMGDGGDRDRRFRGGGDLVVGDRPVTKVLAGDRRVAGAGLPAAKNGLHG